MGSSINLNRSYLYSCHLKNYLPLMPWKDVNSVSYWLTHRFKTAAYLFQGVSWTDETTLNSCLVSFHPCCLTAAVSREGIRCIGKSLAPPRCAPEVFSVSLGIVVSFLVAWL